MSRARNSTTFFFYGTLMDADVRSAVLGKHADAAVVAPDVLAGWRRVGLRGRTYPVIVPSSGARVDGLAVSFAAGARSTVTDLLVSFEGPEYEVETVALSTGTSAYVFVGSRHCHPTGRPWSLSHWQKRHKRAFCAGLTSRG
jgi:hypothetical protein